MWNRKELKSNARHALKLNYIACIAVCFIMIFAAGEYQSTVQFILKYDTQNVADLKYDTDQKIEIVKEIERLSGGKNKLRNIKDSKLSDIIDKVADKNDISDKDSLRAWVDIYIEKGAAALNYKEVTLFGTTGEISNWHTIMRTIETFVSDDVDLETDENITQEEIAYFFDLATKEDSSKIGIINYVIRLFSQEVTWRIFISLGSALLSLFAAIFIAGPLIVGERRFFLENRTYHKTRIGRIGFLFRERCFRPIWTMLVMDLYKFFWSITIVGGFIKTYEYEMIPYILAENPKIDRKKAFKLSKQMMKGNKWRSFLVDCSFIPWILAVGAVASVVALIITGFSYVGVLIVQISVAVLLAFFLNPYKTATKTELYMVLRKKAIENNYNYSEELNDKYLDLDLLEEEIKNTTASGEDGLAAD